MVYVIDTSRLPADSNVTVMSQSCLMVMTVMSQSCLTVMTNDAAAAAVC